MSIKLTEEQKKRLSKMTDSQSQGVPSENLSEGKNAQNTRAGGVSGAQNPSYDGTGRHRQTSEHAGGLAEQAITLLNQQSGSTLSNVQAHIQRLTNSRSTAVEQVSDVLAYLHDPRTLYAEIMQRTNEKLGINEASSLDGLGNPYEGFDVAYPALLPSTIAGCLPIC